MERSPYLIDSPRDTAAKPWPIAAVPRSHEKFVAYNRQTIERLPQWSKVPPAIRESVRLAARIFPFRVSRYVCDELIDWEAVPEDPIFRLLFPLREMLPPGFAERLEDLEQQEAPPAAYRGALNDAWAVMNPHPADQAANVPEQDGEPVDGLQHKYRETVLVFPREGQTCHAHCTYCFRAPQFLPLDLRFQVERIEAITRYIRSHPEISSVLITGGDPMIMRARTLERYIEPLLEIEHVASIRIGSKSLAFYPQVVTSDVDAAAKLRLFERVVASGRQLAFMTQFSHPREMETSAAREAITALQSSGGVLRSQSPVLRHVNDRAEHWEELWRLQNRTGVVPYYFFQARDTGSRDYFQLTLAEALEIFQTAFRRVSGLARTVRGVVMSAADGKVQVLGTQELAAERYFVLTYLQARDPERVGWPFLARYDEKAAWLDELDVV